MIIVSKTKQDVNSIEYLDHTRRGKYALSDTIEEIMKTYGHVEKDKIEKKTDCVKIDYDIYWDDGLINENESYSIYIVLVDG